jgi:hypothetical protein
VRFVYPKGYRLKASAAAGQYVLQGGKDKSLLLSVLPRQLLDGVFERMAAGPSPQSDRVKCVQNVFTLGGKRGRAILWDVFGPNGSLLVKGCDFFFDYDDWSVVIKLHVELPADLRDLEDVIKSLEIEPRADS